MTEAASAKGDRGSVVPACAGAGAVPTAGASPAGAGAGSGDVLTLRLVRKVYGATVAVDGLTLGLAPAAVHALVGENGAGKSTAAQIAAGVVQPTEGQVEFAGEPVVLNSARDAEALGIVLIPQELQLYESLSVAENLYVGRRRPRGRGPFLARRQMARRAEEQLTRVGLHVPPSRRVQELSHSNRQLVAIARALVLDARVLIMDEPTAALDEWEATRLLDLVAALRASGVAVLYVSHRLPEVLRIADTVTVMRDGRLVTSGPRRRFDESALVTAMLGRSLARLGRRTSRVRAEVAFATSGLARAGSFAAVDLTVRAGEVVGMAGLIGSGRSEFARVAFGHDKPTGGTVHIGGTEVRIRSVRRAIELGIGYVPEERQSQGLFLPLSSQENVSLPALRQIGRFGVLSRRREAGYVQEALAPLRIKGRVEDPVATLSGGTQQKVLLGRWLALRPKVLILDEPTRGIDVGTRADIYRLVERLTDAGVAVLLISSDLQELLQLSDRVVVMRAGRLVGEFAGDELTELNIGSAALGASHPGGAP